LGVLGAESPGGATSRLLTCLAAWRSPAAAPILDVMSSAAPRPEPATLADLLSIPEGERFHEVVDGQLVRKAVPSMRHGAAQMGIADEIAGPYGPRSRGRGPGGWVFASEVEIFFAATQTYRPDAAGWRRERLPALPAESPVTVRPDWVCEILSRSNPQNDLIRKMRTYHLAQVGHYWVFDPDGETLSVHRWTAEGYLLAQTAEGRELVRAEPFGEVEISVHGLIEGDDAER
jgi:Uma2 family endonuclease